MNFGTQKETKTIDLDGSTASDIKQFHEGVVVHDYRQFHKRVKVPNLKEEIALIVQFSEEIASYRTEDKLFIDWGNPTTYPCFAYDFPRFNKDDSYFLILSWCEKV